MPARSSDRSVAFLVTNAGALRAARAYASKLVPGLLLVLGACSSSSPTTLTDDISGDDAAGSGSDTTRDATTSSGSESGSDASETHDGGITTRDSGKDGVSASCVLERIDSGIPYNDAGIPVINGKTCDLHENLGCVSLQGVGRCVAKTSSCSASEVVFKCLERTDCPAGQLCCGVDSSNQVGSACATPGSDGLCPATPQGAAQFCQTTCDCPDGVECIPQKCELSGFVPANLTLCGLQTGSGGSSYQCQPR